MKKTRFIPYLTLATVATLGFGFTHSQPSSSTAIDELRLVEERRPSSENVSPDNHRYGYGGYGRHGYGGYGRHGYGGYGRHGYGGYGRYGYGGYGRHGYGGYGRYGRYGRSIHIGILGRLDNFVSSVSASPNLPSPKVDMDTNK